MRTRNYVLPRKSKLQLQEGRLGWRVEGIDGVTRGEARVERMTKPTNLSVLDALSLSTIANEIVGVVEWVLRESESRAPGEELVGQPVPDAVVAAARSALPKLKRARQAQNLYQLSFEGLEEV